MSKLVALSQHRDRTVQHPRAPHKTPPAWQVAVASGAGGIMDAVVSNGLRVLKETRQLQLHPKPLLQDLRGMTPSTLTKGLGLYAPTSGFANMWCFTVQRLIKDAVGQGEKPNWRLNVLAAVMAGASEAVVTLPARRVLVAMSKPGASQSLRTAVTHMVQKEGMGALTRGAGAAMMRNAMTAGVFFPLLACLSHEGQSTQRSLAAGAMAGALTAVLCNPADTLVSVMQAQAKGGLGQVAHGLWQRGGPGVFFNGAAPNGARAMLAAGASFATNTAVGNALQKMSQDKTA